MNECDCPYPLLAPWDHNPTCENYRSQNHNPLSFVSAADLLDPEPIPPIEFVKPTRPRSLRGHAIPPRADR